MTDQQTDYQADYRADEKAEFKADLKAKLRSLPSIDKLLTDSGAADLIMLYGRDAVRDALRIVLEAAREWIRQGGTPPQVAEFFHSAAEVLGKTYQPTLRPVINATGVIIHTNLGRAPLSEAAQAAMVAVAGGYSTLEYDLEPGTRGKRDMHIEALVKAITGAEAALVVNNNAAAVILLLSALAQGKEVIISRGQLVEIGGGFRVPEIMTRSGATLVEVGTTNRTNRDDFEEAITPQTALLMRAHASNFKQIGFTEQPELRDLTEIAHKHGLYAVDDLGSGALLDTAAYGLDHEPTVQESIHAGIDLVAFSGDKLLGGPQAGIIVGKAELVKKLKKHPLARAMRIDKLCLAALTATLSHYRMGNALTEIPVWRMIATPVDDLRARAEAWAAEVGGEVIAEQSTVGGGSLPGATLPTAALALTVPNADAFAASLRRQPFPVIARIVDGRVILDPRTVLPTQHAEVVRALKAALGE
jgi:L-seryl-tRNA(Ser) seleniumtransferase